MQPSCSMLRELLQFQDAGIGTALIVTMRTHAADADVQYAACIAMDSLAYSVGSAEVERAFRSAAAGAIDALAEALRAHIQHPMVPRQALYALRAMAVPGFGPADATLPQRLHAAQVAQAVVAAMRIDVAHQSLQAAAASAIRDMTERNNAGGAAIAQQFLDAGAGNALMNALAASTIGGADSDTLKALAALARYGSSAAQLLAAGVAEAIIAAVDKHCTRGRMLSADYYSKRVLESALSAIATLAASAPADRARLSTAGACEVVVSAVQQLLNDVQRFDVAFYSELLPGLKALAALAAAGESHSQAVAQSLVQAGACEVATAVLKAVLLKPPSGHSELLTLALRTICSLSADAGAAALLTAAGAHEAVTSAIPKCSNCLEAAQAAQLALDRLAGGAANTSSE
eukprot:TRINITY_DN2118_c0_g1_i1.p1 TRINITY_DN2118_c0_g1~~TRINITY_DN2118_c0_g1_i1.p1  ORF type:complete len:403 (+),score=89.62 TRINITY_DN2118_c0_g1_i1:160-1368(+)